MADDKKPKIDLKARLGKAAAPAPTPTPAPTATPSGRPMPMPAPSAGRSQPPPGVLPVPSPSRPAGIPIPGPSAFGGAAPAGFDPSNPLAAAVAAPYQARQAAPAQPAQPQRIEFDDLTVQQASRGGVKKGIAIGVVLAVIFGVVGYVGGQSTEQASGRASAKAGAVDMANSATKAQEQLKKLGDAVLAGFMKLTTERKFPETLARDLSAVNIDFDGKQLEGRRFSGFSADTTRDLVEFITAVQGVNERREFMQRLLTTLQKPITAQLAVPAGEIKVNYVVAVDKDPGQNFAGFITRLSDPITVTGSNVSLPAEFKFVTPGGGAIQTAPAFKGGDIGKTKGVVYVVPKTFDTVCPSATRGQITQLTAQMLSFVTDIEGDTAIADAKRKIDPTPQPGEAGAKCSAADECTSGVCNGGKCAAPDVVADSKPSLLDRAAKLVKELGTVGS